MQKEDAIRIMVECAECYRDELVNRNLLFVFGTLQTADQFETAFLPRHFLHLTGVGIARGAISSSEFYDRCIHKRLRSSDFDLPEDGIADMKLAVLPQLMHIYRTAKMVGDYDNTKSLLYTEKMAGNISACMGFVRENHFYVPNTALREDIRDITRRPQKRVLAVFRKAIKDSFYTEMCYIAKGIDSAQIRLLPEIKHRISKCNEQDQITQGDKENKAE